MSRSTGAPPHNTANDSEPGKSGLGLLRDFLGTLPGLLTGVAALITAIAGAFVGGTQLAGHPQAQPTVVVTVTTGAGRGVASTSAAGGTPRPSTASAQAGTTAPTVPQSNPATVSGTSLSTLTPLQSTVDKFTATPQRVGTSSYQDAIRFSCSSTQSAYGYNTVVYDVAGYATLDATIGVPDDAGNAAGNSATIDFYKDGTSTRLGPPLTVALDSPQHVHLNLQGSSQLEIDCTAANPANTYNGDDIDIALGNAKLIR